MTSIVHILFVDTETWNGFLGFYKGHKQSKFSTLLGQLLDSRPDLGPHREESRDSWLSLFLKALKLLLVPDSAVT